MSIETLTRREEDILGSLAFYSKPLQEESFHLALYQVQEQMIAGGRWRDRALEFQERPSSNGQPNRTTMHSEELHNIVESLIQKKYVRRDERQLLCLVPNNL